MAEKITGIVNMGGEVKVENCAVGKNAKVTVVDGKKADSEDPKKK
ncbi:hypothetical protein [Actinomadura rubrisoli]|nr:hypothetical protein [Actinomadura rubrisoli]